MLASGRLTCFWPGLASTWHRGNTTSLAVAIFSAWSLVLLLLATFVWPEWVSALAIRGLWLVAVTAWLIASVQSHWVFSQLMQTSKPLVAKDEFLQAQADYLAGNWFEAEAKLLQILHNFPRDAECQLLLVGVLRHTRRFRPALRRLAHLETLDSAARWRFEIIQERSIMERRIAEASDDSEPFEESKLSEASESSEDPTPDSEKLPQSAKSGIGEQ